LEPPNSALKGWESGDYETTKSELRTTLSY